MRKGENKAEVEVEADRAVEDSTDYIQMNGLTLEATNNGMYRVATVVHPDGQRNDSEPVVLVGSRYHDKKLYRGYLKREDSSLVDGPLLMGFYSSRSASSALRHYCEDEEIHGVIKLNELDIEHLKGTYDRADGIEYAGHVSGYNDPIRTPDHPTKSHAVLARRKQGQADPLWSAGGQRQPKA